MNRNLSLRTFTLLEFAPAFGTGPYAKHSRASAFFFFCPQPWFLRGYVRTHFSTKNTCVYRHSHISGNSRNIKSSGSTHRLNLQHLANVPTLNIAALVPSGFCCPQPWFLRRLNTFPHKNTRVCIPIEL